MEMIILIGCFWELELEYTSKCVYKQTGFETRFFVPIRIFMLLFFFFCETFLSLLPSRYRAYFFLPPFSRKNPSPFVSSKEKKRKERRNEQKKMEILRHLRISFFFHSFFNKCVYFLYGCFERKILFLLREICNARIYNYYYTCIII